MTKKRVLVWLSGGVDSAVAAYLLLQQGYEVTGGFMINYLADDGNCPTRTDLDEAKKVADFLGIQLFTFDFTVEYEKLIMDYIFEWYRKGITPNPDVLCNSLVKFDLFLKEAISYGFDYVATGHYARIEKDTAGICHLLKGNDPNKDQSYFLAGLNQEQLSRSLFPIGDIPKPEVRKIALDAKLPNATRKDSQGLCFIGKVDMKDFLAQKIAKKPGDILDTSGKKVGEHDGAYFYTIGQRKWIKIWGWPALFVVKKDVDKNVVIVWDESDLDLYSDRLFAREWHWIWESRALPFDAKAKIRYRQADQDVKLTNAGDNRLEAIFPDRQRAITSGQTIAVYDGDELIGSGTIE